eukprot:4852646-Heterocapsa_arctica.AAC.1
MVHLVTRESLKFPPAPSGRVGRQTELAPANPPKRKQVAQEVTLELGEGPVIGGQALRRLFARKGPVAPEWTQDNFPHLPAAGDTIGAVPRREGQE